MRIPRVVAETYLAAIRHELCWMREDSDRRVLWMDQYDMVRIDRLASSMREKDL